MLEHGNDEPDAGPELSPDELIDQMFKPVQPPPPGVSQQELERWVDSLPWDRMIADPPDDDDGSALDDEDDVHGRRSGGSEFVGSGLSGVTSTGYAVAIADLIGRDRARVWGYSSDSNPLGVISAEYDGTDFVIVDDRYLIDPWLSCVESYTTQVVFDLNSPHDAAEIKRIYGNRLLWEPTNL